jgi:hypothetical protein
MVPDRFYCREQLMRIILRSSFHEEATQERVKGAKVLLVKGNKTQVCGQGKGAGVRKKLKCWWSKRWKECKRKKLGPKSFGNGSKKLVGEVVVEGLVKIKLARAPR